MYEGARVLVTYPDVSKDGRVGALAVAPIVLGQDGRHGHGNADEAVLVHADPDDVEPGQAALGRAPGAAIAAAALGEPVDGHDPALDRAKASEELLLRMQVGRAVVADEAEEGGNGKGLVAVGDDGEVGGAPVPLQLHVRGDGVDGDHEEDADDAAEVSRMCAIDASKTNCSGMLTVAAPWAVCNAWRA